MEKDIEKKNDKTFEELKHIDENGSEYWSARELYLVLDYRSWDQFKNVIEKAIIACTNSNQDAKNHFSHVGKMVKLESSSPRIIEDYHLSRYACYLII